MGHLMFWNRRSWTFHISVQILKYICASSQFSSPNSSTKCLHSSSSPRKNLQKSTCPRGVRLWNSRMTSNKKQTYKQKKTRTENISWRQNKGNGARLLSGMKPKDRIWKQKNPKIFRSLYLSSVGNLEVRPLSWIERKRENVKHM